MSSKETKIGGETRQGHEDVPERAPPAVRKRTGQISDGSDVVLDDINIHEEDLKPYLTPNFERCAEALSSLGGLYSERGVVIIGSLNSSYIIDITDEEVNSYISSSAVKEKLKSLDDALVMKPCQTKIEKVPFILSENTNFQKYYKPRMVSINPYHHRIQNLNMIERLKPKIAMLFIQKRGLCKEVIYSKIRKELGVLKEFYEKDAVETFKDDDDLAWMFFLDGCLVLNYIYCAIENKNDEDKYQFQIWDIKPDCLTFVKHDLFLLKNQLPYRVLELVINCLDNEDKIKFINSIEDFILDSIKAQWGNHEKLDREPCQNKDPKHLLDLLREKNPPIGCEKYKVALHSSTSSQACKNKERRYS